MTGADIYFLIMVLFLYVMLRQARQRSPQASHTPHIPPRPMPKPKPLVNKENPMSRESIPMPDGINRPAAPAAPPVLINPVSDPDNTEKLERQRLQAENRKLRELLNTAAGLLFRLEEYKCIQTDDEAFEPELDHWRGIGRDVVSQARTLLNTDYQP